MKNILRVIDRSLADVKIDQAGALASLLLAVSLMAPALPGQDLRTDQALTNLTAEPKFDEAVLSTITVTSTTDIIDAAGTCPTVTVASLPGPNGVTSLREAICAANNNPGADTINFAINGMFTLTGAANEDNGTSGDLDLKDSVTINGNGIGNTIISGGGIERIFDFFPSAASTFGLSGLTLQNGDTRMAAFKEAGAVYLHNNVTSTISNCQIINNFSGSSGVLENRGSLTISNSIISGNQTIPATGSVEGGAIRNSGSLSITNTTIDNNLVRGEGGGIATTVAVGVTVSITNSTISNNTASVIGGGLGNGGAISTTGNDGSITLTNSTISGNHADNNGGGAYFVTPSGTGNATLTSVTITNNTADNDNNGTGVGGGISQSVSPVTLRNTIVAGNFNSIVSVRDDINGTVQASSSFNLIGDGTGSAGITNGVNSNQVGSGASPINAMVSPLANNGGPTLTHNLGPTSPAYDKGNSFTLTTDQRGTPRPFDNIFVPPAPGGDNSDIGSVESLLPTAAPVNLSGRVMTSTGLPIRGATVSLTGGALGQPISTKTNTFGYYAFTDLQPGTTYVVSLQAKKYVVTHPVRVVSLTADLAGIDFVAEPR